MKEFIEKLRTGSLTGNERIIPIYSEYDEPDINRSEVLRYAWEEDIFAPGVMDRQDRIAVTLEKKIELAAVLRKFPRFYGERGIKRNLLNHCW